jgi:hypothetical protein
LRFQVTLESQPSDKLKAILEQAKARTAAQAAEHATAREAGPTDLVDKDAALPDPRALARLYQSADLKEKLPEIPPAGPAEPRPAGQGMLPAGPTAVTRPSMTPAELRAVMAELQDTFHVSDRSYETYELSSSPVDDLPVVTDEEKELERAEAMATVAEATGGTGLYLLGAGLVLLVVIIFVLLAVNGVGPFKPAPNRILVSPSPAAATSP